MEVDVLKWATILTKLNISCVAVHLFLFAIHPLQFALVETLKIQINIAKILFTLV